MVEMTFTHTATARQFQQHFCTNCFDDLLRAYPEVRKELKDAEMQRCPAQIKFLPSELIPEGFQQLVRKR